MSNKLKINSVFQILSYPYFKEEFAKLEEGIMKEGCLEPRQQSTRNKINNKTLCVNGDGSH